MNMDHRRIQRIKDQYPPDTRIELVSMSGEAVCPAGYRVRWIVWMISASSK